MDIIKIIIVDDHPIFRQGLITLLNRIPNVKVIGEAANGEEFLSLLEKMKPDVVLMDIKMPKMNGIETTRKALKLYPYLKIIILTMFGDERYFNDVIALGASGFLLKKVDYNELERAVQVVAAGGTYFSDEHISHLESLNESEKNQPKLQIRLSKRETEILKLICKGYTTPEIAEKIHLSQRTVEGHRASLMNKTNSKNSIALVLFAIKHKLVKLDDNGNNNENS